MPTIILKYTAPAPLSVANVRGYILSTCQKYERLIEADLNQITATWKEHKPTFNHSVRYARGNARIRFNSPGYGAGKSNQVFNVLNKGSGPRWAVMSKGFVPKTKHRWIGSQAGRGQAVIKGRNAMMRAGIPPKPPIQGREFYDAIRVKHRESFNKDIIDAVRKGLKAGGRR